MLYQT